MVYPQKTTFVKNDVAILQEFCEVKQQQFFLKKSTLTFFYYQFKGILELIKNIPSRDLVYVWFNDYHAFWACLLAKIFRKKVLVVVGGYDAVCIPSVEFGLFYKKNLRTRLARWVYQNVDHILPVDESMIKNKNSYAGGDATTGILNFMPELKTPMTVIPTGYAAGDWYAKQKKNQVLTVGQISGKKVYWLKGIDFFLKLAERHPQIKFIVAGVQQENLIPEKFKALKNLQILPHLEKEELKELYAETKVYAQFSLSEGLPNVLCEAMMSECVPVGSAVNGIPRAIGDCGYILNSPNLEEASEKILKALENNEIGKCARNRILTHFPVSLRKKSLNQIIHDLLD